MSAPQPIVLSRVADAYPRVGEYVVETGVTFTPARITGPAAVRDGREVLVHLTLEDIQKLLGALPALYMFDQSSDAYLALMSLLKALKEI